MASTDSLFADRLAAELRLAREAAADGPESDRLQRLRQVLADGLKGLDAQRRKECLAHLGRSFPAFGAYEIQATAPPPAPAEVRRGTVAELIHELADAASRSSRPEVVKSAQSALEVLAKQDPQKHAELLEVFRALAQAVQAKPAPAAAPPPPPKAPEGKGAALGLPFNLGGSVQPDELERLVSAVDNLRNRVAGIHQRAGDLLSTVVNQVVSHELAAQDDLRELLPKHDGNSLDKAVQTTVKGGKMDAVGRWLSEFERRCNVLFLMVRYGPEQFSGFLQETFQPDAIMRNASPNSWSSKPAVYWKQYQEDYLRYFPESTTSIEATIAKAMCDAYLRRFSEENSGKL